MDIVGASNMQQDYVKRCKICGNEAIGFNFQCISCSGCKSFFRRNALKYEQFKCLKSNSCEIDFLTRKACNKCRLEKCFNAGMQVQLLYSRMKSSLSPLKTFMDVEIKMKMAQCSGESDPLDHSLNNGPMFTLNCYSIELKEFEINFIREIQHANAKAGFFDANRYNIKGECNEIMEVIDIFEAYTRKIVKFCKGISAFCNLKQPDQLIILKEFVLELVMILIAFLYNPELDAYPLIKNEETNEAVSVNFKLLSETNKKDWTLYLLQKCSVLHELLENDPIIRDLIVTTLLFQPRENCNLTCNEFVQYNYCLYYYLGNRYLEAKYADVQRATAKIKMLLELKEDLSFVKQLVESILLEDVSELPDILSELFNK